DSTHMRERVEAVEADLLKHRFSAEPGKSKLLETRKDVRRGWAAISEQLMAEGRRDLVASADRFAAQMPPPKTEREWIRDELLNKIRHERSREGRSVEYLLR